MSVLSEGGLKVVGIAYQEASVLVVTSHFGCPCREPLSQPSSLPWALSYLSSLIVL